MNVEAIVAVAISCFVLAAAYFLDHYQARIFRNARPSTLERQKRQR